MSVKDGLSEFNLLKGHCLDDDGDLYTYKVLQIVTKEKDHDAEKAVMLKRWNLVLSLVTEHQCKQQILYQVMYYPCGELFHILMFPLLSLIELEV